MPLRYNVTRDDTTETSTDLSDKTPFSLRSPSAIPPFALLISEEEALTRQFEQLIISIKGEASKPKGKESEKKQEEDPKTNVDSTTDNNDEENLKNKLDNIMEGLRLLYEKLTKSIGLTF